MSMKNLVNGSIILMVILILMSMAANSAVDNSIKTTDRYLAGQPINDPSIRNGNTPLKSLKTSPQGGTATLDDAEKNPSLFKKLAEKIFQSVVDMVESTHPSNTGAQFQSSNSTSTYEEMLQNNPLTDEQLAEIEKYSGGKSPAELISAYCQDAQSPEFEEMIKSIKDSYGNDPNSPAALMDLYQSMAKLCPTTK
jgi:hypothetical protein